MIDLPERFANDIQGKDTYLVPLIVINNSVYLSTGKTTLDGVNYNPLIKSIGSIKQSVDLIEKKFKISSVEMDFYNYDYNNTTLTETMFSSEIMNRPIDVYFKSPSAETLDDCLPVYSGYIKNISENIDVVKLEIEDRTEQTLKNELPYKYSASEGLPDKYKNTPMPITYGVVEKAPLVYNKVDNDDLLEQYEIISDLFYTQDIDNFKVFTNNAYLTIPETAFTHIDSIAPSISPTQYEKIGTSFVIDVAQQNNNQSTTGQSYTQGSLPSNNLIEVLESYTPRFSSGELRVTYHDSNYVDHYVQNISAYVDEEGEIPSDGSIENGLYIMVKNYEAGNPIEQQFWGRILTQSTGSSFYQNAANQDIRGYDIVTFETDAFCSSSDTLSRFNAADLRALAWLDYDMNIKFTSIASGNYNPSPRLYINFADGTDHQENDSFYDLNLHNYAGEVQIGGTTVELSTTKIYDNKFSIGDSVLDNVQYQLVDSGGYIEWIRPNSMTLWKNAILKDFNKYDLYATVHGRVDNMEGRYTGLSTLSAEQMRNYVEGKKPTLQGKAIAPTRPSARKPVARIPIKKKINPKSTKGGY